MENNIISSFAELNNNIEEGNGKTNPVMEEIEISTISGKLNNAVMVRNAYKRYTASTIVLNGLNLTVREGTM